MSLISYLRLIGAHGRFLSFGFTMTFAASAGQTVIIGTFGPAVRGEYGLSHTEWSGIYMIGTLASAFVLPWTGQQIDRYPLRAFAIVVCLGLVFASAFMALVPSAAFLIVAIFLLRQFGQGLASHTGKTATARFFHIDRGKAIALVLLGDGVGLVRGVPTGRLTAAALLQTIIDALLPVRVVGIRHRVAGGPSAEQHEHEQRTPHRAHSAGIDSTTALSRPSPSS